RGRELERLARGLLVGFAPAMRAIGVERAIGGAEHRRDPEPLVRDELARGRPARLLDLRTDQTYVTDPELPPQRDVIAQRQPVRRARVDREPRVDRHAAKSTPPRA